MLRKSTKEGWTIWKFLWFDPTRWPHTHLKILNAYPTIPHTPNCRKSTSRDHFSGDFFSRGPLFQCFLFLDFISRNPKFSKYFIQTQIWDKHFSRVGITPINFTKIWVQGEVLVLSLLVLIFPQLNFSSNFSSSSRYLLNLIRWCTVFYITFTIFWSKANKPSTEVT